MQATSSVMASNILSPFPSTECLKHLPTNIKCVYHCIVVTCLKLKKCNLPHWLTNLSSSHSAVESSRNNAVEHQQNLAQYNTCGKLQRESVNEYNTDLSFENRRYAIPGACIYYLCCVLLTQCITVLLLHNEVLTRCNIT